MPEPILTDTRELALLLTTVATRQEADRLARDLVAQRLAACVHINAIDSVYHWQGQVHAEGEWRLLIKTTPARVPAVRAALRAQHPYALPAILSLPCQALPDFADWVQTQTADTAPAAAT